MRLNIFLLALILNIETSTTNCSVALAEDGEVIQSIAMNEGYKHAEQLLPFIQKMFVETGIELRTIDAIAVSSGPGSYTGLRIGIASAKGMAFALDKPLIAINSLEIMTHQVIQAFPNYEYYIPMLDARRMEVYTAIYDSILQPKLKTLSVIVDTETFLEQTQNMPVVFFGDGSMKCLETFANRSNYKHLQGIFPNAEYMASLTYKSYLETQFVSLAYLEPNYLKKFFTQQSSN